MWAVLLLCAICTFSGAADGSTSHTCDIVKSSIQDPEFLKLPIPSTPTVSYLDAWLKPEAARFGPAIRDIPEVLQDAFTLGGAVAAIPRYFDNAYLGGKARVSTWSVALVDELRGAVRSKREVFNYPNAPLYETMDHRRDLIAGKHGLVIGSEWPWLEAMLLENGAARVSTLEFGAIESEHPQIDTFTPQNFTQGFIKGEIPPFDFAFSYSSLEHDGLGRYGDVLNPDGDLQTMAKLMHIVKPGGFLFLGVPCCHDLLEWNAHRIYGPLRLPRMFAGWHVAGVHPKDIKLGDTSVKDEYQPVWVLQNLQGCSADRPLTFPLSALSASGISAHKTCSQS
jgi:hypothetical protein